MRIARIKADGAGYYHCMSRIIERRAILTDAEKERLLVSMRKLAAFGFIEILTYVFMSTHFHMLLYVPERRDLSDEELLTQLRHIYTGPQVDQIAKQLADYRQQGLEPAAAVLKNSFTYRMFDISSFFKAFKQQFAQYYNAREGRRGPLWEQRFKSILVEGSEDALMTMAAYIDLNPIRAGMVKDPKDYRYSGYGAAVGGSKEARQGLRRLMQAACGGTALPWDKAQPEYRQRLYVQGQQKGLDPEGKPIRKGFSPDEVEKVIESGGRLPIKDLLRCRVRYFSDGLVLGSEAFVEGVFARYKSHFGTKRLTGARPMRYGEWCGLCTMRDLRLQPIGGT